MPFIILFIPIGLFFIFYIGIFYRTLKQSKSAKFHKSINRKLIINNMQKKSNTEKLQESYAFDRAEIEKNEKKLQKKLKKNNPISLINLNPSPKKVPKSQEKRPQIAQTTHTSNKKSDSEELDYIVSKKNSKKKQILNSEEDEDSKTEEILSPKQSSQKPQQQKQNSNSPKQFQAQSSGSKSKLLSIIQTKHVQQKLTFGKKQNDYSITSFLIPKNKSEEELQIELALKESLNTSKAPANSFTQPSQPSSYANQQTKSIQSKPINSEKQEYPNQQNPSSLQQVNSSYQQSISQKPSKPSNDHQEGPQKFHRTHSSHIKQRKIEELDEEEQLKIALRESLKSAEKSAPNAYKASSKKIEEEPDNTKVTKEGKKKGKGKAPVARIQRDADGNEIQEEKVSKQTGVEVCLKGTFLSSQTIVMTGEFDDFSKDELSELLTSYGARVTKSVSKKTTILLAGTKLEDGRDVNTSRKYQQALKLGTKIMDIYAFTDYFKEISKGIELKDLKSSSLSAQFVRPGQNKVPLRPTGFPSNGSGQKDKGEGKQTPSILSAGKPVQPQPCFELWTSKYAPTRLDQLLGNKGELKKLIEWLRDWDDVILKGIKKETKKTKFFRGAAQFQAMNASNPNQKGCLISGPPGVGKTTAVRVVCDFLGKNFLEKNASDERNKKNITQFLSHLGEGRVFYKEAAKTQISSNLVIVMDEVDGMSSGDRGGLAALVQFIKTTKKPVICICNDIQNQKLGTLKNYCYELKFRPPSKQEILPLLKHIALREQVGTDLTDIDFLNFCDTLQCDLRNVLNTFQFDHKNLRNINAFAKDQTVQLNNYTAASKLMNQFEVKQSTLKQKMNLFFIDYDLIPMLIQENILSTIMSYDQKSEKVPLSELKSIYHALDAIADSDCINKQIRTHQEWGLLSSYGFLSSVYPCELLCQKCTFPRFPEWLGKFQTNKKHKREVREMKGLYCKQISTNAFSAQFEICSTLFKVVIKMLKKELLEEVIELMELYNFGPEQLKEQLSDIQYPKSDAFGELSPQVKSSLTRMYNKRHCQLKMIKQSRSKKMDVEDFHLFEEEQFRMEEEETKSDEESSVNFSKTKTKKRKASNK